MSYGHDDLGNVVAMADPHLGQWFYRRDSGGRVREQIDGKGQKIVFTFGAPNGVPEGDAASEDTLYAIAEAWFTATAE